MMDDCLHCFSTWQPDFVCSKPEKNNWCLMEDYNNLRNVVLSIKVHHPILLLKSLPSSNQQLVNILLL